LSRGTNWDIANYHATLCCVSRRWRLRNHRAALACVVCQASRGPASRPFKPAHAFTRPKKAAWRRFSLPLIFLGFRKANRLNNFAQTLKL
jgi:hypothetical protein